MREWRPRNGNSGVPSPRWTSNFKVVVGDAGWQLEKFKKKIHIIIICTIHNTVSVGFVILTPSKIIL